MKRQMWKWMAALGVVALLLGGCDDDTGTGDNIDVRGGDNVLPDGNIATNTLVIENPAADENGDHVLKLVYNSDANIDVRYLDVNNSPIDGANLSFDILTSTDDCGFDCLQPEALEGSTNGDGYVSMKVSSKDQDADILLQISVVGNESVAPVEVLVKVRAKDSYDLVVKWNYDGIRSSFAGIKPLLFDGDSASCADLFTAPLRDPGDIGQPARRQNPDAERSADGSIADSVFTSLANNSTYTVVGYGLTEAGLVTVYGCNDERPTITDGRNTVIEVDLQEVPILIAGTYDLTSNFDLTSAFPRAENPAGFGDYEIGNYLDDILNLFANPGEQIWAWLYAIPAIRDNLPDAIGNLGPVVGQIIDSAIESFAPAWFNNALVVADDISNLLTSLQLEGELVINDEPDAFGKLPEGQIHRYFAVTYTWTLPCANGESSNCGPVTKNLKEVTGDPTLDVSGTWTGTVSGDQLTIERHGLLIPIGAIALGIFETVALPAIMDDPNINSLDKFVDALIIGNLVNLWNNRDDVDISCTSNCSGGLKPAIPCGSLYGDGNSLCDCGNAGDVLGLLVDENGGFASGIVSTIGQYGCSEGKAFILDFIREFFNGIQVDSEDAFQISTANPCALLDVDGNLEYDKIGETNARCDWQMDITFNSGTDVYTGTGIFFGER